MVILFLTRVNNCIWTLHQRLVCYPVGCSHSNVKHCFITLEQKIVASLSRIMQCLNFMALLKSKCNEHCFVNTYCTCSHWHVGITPVSISLCMVCTLVFYIIAFYLVPAWAVVLHEVVPFLSLWELLPVHLRVKMQQIWMHKVKDSGPGFSYIRVFEYWKFFISILINFLQWMWTRSKIPTCYTFLSS